MKVTIKIKHIPSGEIRDYHDEFEEITEQTDYNPIWIWQEGNYSCDCNRHIFFHNFKDDEDIDCSDGIYKVNIFDSNNKCLYKEY